MSLQIVAHCSPHNLKQSHLMLDKSFVARCPDPHPSNRDSPDNPENPQSGPNQPQILKSSARSSQSSDLTNLAPNTCSEVSRSRDHLLTLLAQTPQSSWPSNQSPAHNGLASQIAPRFNERDCEARDDQSQARYSDMHPDRAIERLQNENGRKMNITDRKQNTDSQTNNNRPQHRDERPQSNEGPQNSNPEPLNSYVDPQNSLPNTTSDGERPSLFLKPCQPVSLQGGEELSDISEDYEEASSSEIKSHAQSSVPAPASQETWKDFPATFKKEQVPGHSGADRQEKSSLQTANAPILAVPSADNPKNIFYILNSPSPPDKSSNTQKRSDSLFAINQLVMESQVDLASSASSLEVSEDEEEYDEQNETRGAAHTIRFVEPKLGKSNKSVKLADTDSEWMSFSSDGDLVEPSPVQAPLSFSKRIPLSTSPQTSVQVLRADNLTKKEAGLATPQSLLSGLFLNHMAHNAVKNGSKMDKELPGSNQKTSLTHLELTALNQKPVLKRSSTTGIITVDRNTNTKMLQRPSIILSKRYGPPSDISQNVNHLNTHRSPVLYVEEEDTGTEGKSGTLEENQFTKQLSSVGLLDLMVVANSNSNFSVLESHVGNGPEQSKIVRQQLSRSESRLLTSLSKFQPSAPTSFKSFLSKSSLNLSSLFGQQKQGKTRPEHPIASAETVELAPTPKSPKREEVSTSPRTTEPLAMLSRSSMVWEYPKKDFKPSLEISDSLKDSLLIDYKLGKNPLPDRVINEKGLFGKDFMATEGYDDYHAKGF